MSHNNHKGGAAIYIITAIALGIITYIEFGLIQYNWMEGSSAVFTLVALSIVKFLAVISIFMHLKDDNKTLSGFFTAGLIFSFATFIAMSFLFTAKTTRNYVKAPATGNISHETTNKHQLVIEEAGFKYPSGPNNQAFTIEKPLDTKEDYSFSLAASESSTNQTSITENLASADSFDWQELGKITFNSCASCHQATGNGISGAFPPLNKNAALKYNANKDYLLKAVTFGLTGEIDVDGSSYNGAMPNWGYLSDEEIAAVLNYVLSSWDNPANIIDFKAYNPADVANIRGLDLSTDDTLKQRP